MREIKRYVTPGETVRLELPYSEVCMHMRVAGRRMDVTLTECGRGAQLVKDNGAPFSFPILPSEAGFYWDSEANAHYYYTQIAAVDAAPVALSA